MGSAFPYPLPWYLVPVNIYLCLRMAYAVHFGSFVKEFKSHIKAQNYAMHTPFLDFVHEDVPMMLGTSEDIEFPISVPNQVFPVGPIFMALETAESRDPELTAWLAHAPTVLIILGSHTEYYENDATAMIYPIHRVLEGNDQVQVLWKLLLPADGSPSASEEDLASLRATGRVRVESWLNADPASLLETGNVVAYVHHGGGSSYLESIG